ncbi:hypothetical protein MKX03_009143 [Papaver bracteatum]|nr:hypothetical protein MKX03_009143 [Papaver bracteatum]
MNLSCGGEGVLPEKLQTMKLVNLADAFLLQVNEIVSVYPKDRFKELSMTNGVRSAYGVEDRPIKNLHVLSPAGLKVVIRDVNVRDGLLMLVPGCLKVLGGMPLWVKRMRALSGSAIGAQKPNDVDGSAKGFGYGAIATLQDAIPSRSSIQGTPYAPSTTNTFSRSRGRTQQETENPSEASAGFNEIDMVDATVAMSKIDISTSDIVVRCKRLNVERNPSHDDVPYTYLDDLLSYWAEKRNYIPLIQTRIKCKVTKYELLVSVDDGSASSDVCIHHDVVLREVGYTPEQVNAAILTPDKHDIDGKIWKAMMALKMNKKHSSVHVALKMNNETATFDNLWVMEPVH